LAAVVQRFPKARTGLSITRIDDFYRSILNVAESDLFMYARRHPWATYRIDCFLLADGNQCGHKVDVTIKELWHTMGTSTLCRLEWKFKVCEEKQMQRKHVCSQCGDMLFRNEILLEGQTL